MYNATLLTTNPTQSGLELNPGLYNERPATNSLSYQNSLTSARYITRTPHVKFEVLGATACKNTYRCTAG